MMAYLMRNDVSLSKIAGRAKPGMKLFKKNKIKIDLVIGRTIKRAHGSFGHTASGFNRSGKQDQFRLLICPSRILKRILPDIFRLGQNHRDKITHVVIGFTTHALLGSY